MLASHDHPMLEMVSISCLELYQLLQYSYVCSSVMSVHPKGVGSARDTRVSLTSVDMVVTALSEPFHNPPRSVCGVGGT